MAAAAVTAAAGSAGAAGNANVTASPITHPPPKGIRTPRTLSPARIRPGLLNQTAPAALAPIRKGAGGRLSRCQSPDCLTIACFGEEGDRIPRFCAKHKARPPPPPP
jgi:hypothetical protein